MACPYNGVPLQKKPTGEEVRLYKGRDDQGAKSKFNWDQVRPFLVVYTMPNLFAVHTNSLVASRFRFLNPEY